ncbi:hypothetical protein ACFL35_21470, partial [Candidatus Riflebacteria bacterium]
RVHKYNYFCKSGGLLKLSGYNRYGEPIIVCETHGNQNKPIPMKNIKQKFVYFPSYKKIILSNIRKVIIQISANEFKLEIIQYPGRTLSPENFQGYLSWLTKYIKGNYYFKNGLLKKSLAILKNLNIQKDEKKNSIIVSSALHTFTTTEFFLELIGQIICHWNTKRLLIAVKSYNLNHFPMLKTINYMRLNMWTKEEFGIYPCIFRGRYTAPDLIDELKVDCSLHGREIRIPKKSRFF